MSGRVVGGEIEPGSGMVGGVVSLDSLSRSRNRYIVLGGHPVLHLIDIFFLPYICLWQIKQIQTCLHIVVGPGLVLT